MQGDTRFIRTLQLRNLLSFGPDSPPIELGPLNVLIGPNGSGKSNVIEAIDLLRASATDLVAPVRAGGGTEEWLWKGPSRVDSEGRPLKDLSFSYGTPRIIPTAELNASIKYSDGMLPLRHRIAFTMVGQSFKLVDEEIEDERDDSAAIKNKKILFRYQKGSPIFSVRRGDKGSKSDGNARIEAELQPDELRSDQSVLAQLRHPDLLPEITYLGNTYKQIKLYREWNFGRNSAPRLPQPVDLPNDFLAEDASNIGLVLNFLTQRGEIRATLISQLTRFYEQVTDFSTFVQGGTVQVFLHEKGLNHPIPATRLSNGTLRFLCLASILCHPSPPPLICIEEPEIGLHPDILPVVADLLIEASHRTQIIVTTHSDILVDALTYVPEAVLVCEKETNATAVRRLDQNALREWLKEYSLGDLWRSGELGGNRW